MIVILSQIFETIRERLTAETVERFKERATRDLDNWRTLLNSYEAFVTVNPSRERDIRKMVLKRPKYVKYALASDNFGMKWPIRFMRREVNGGLIVEDFKTATEDALAEVSKTKDRFINRAIEKLSIVTQFHAGEFTLQGIARFNYFGLVFELWMTYPSGDRFRLDISLSHQGDDALRLSSIFSNVLVKGSSRRISSEAWMRENFR